VGTRKFRGNSGRFACTRLCPRFGWGVVVLEGEDASIFERFNLLLYTGRFLKEDETVKDVGWETSIQIYIFAETHGAHRLQNTTIDHMIKMNAVLKVLPGGPDIRRAWSGTFGASPIKRFLVDLYTRKADLPTGHRAALDLRGHRAAESHVISAESTLMTVAFSVGNAIGSVGFDWFGATRTPSRVDRAVNVHQLIHAGGGLLLGGPSTGALNLSNPIFSTKFTHLSIIFALLEPSHHALKFGVSRDFSYAVACSVAFQTGWVVLHDKNPALKNLINSLSGFAHQTTAS